MQASIDESLTSPPLLSIFILSGAALAYEVLLIRLFSIIHWHHFAFMVISIALLGYGVSGSFITIFRKHFIKHFDLFFITNILLFGISAISCFLVVQQLPFNALEILWDSSQWQRLLLSYLLLTLPFFFVANAIALSIMYFDKKIALVYGIDLLGAGLGAVSVMLLLQVFPADTLLRILAIGGFSAGFFALSALNRKQRLISLSALILCILAVFIAPQHWLNLQLSEYKGLSQTLLMKDVSLRYTHSSPISQTDVVQSPFIPFRNAPGLSLQSPSGPPDQLAVFRDGDEMTTIDHVTDNNSLEYLDYMSSALPYHVHPSAQNALILASASGTNILQADYHNITKIDAVEEDKQLSQLFTDVFADYFNWPGLKHKVTLHNISPRGLVASKNNFDLIILGPSGASAGGSAGVHALSTSYNLTVEALQSYLNRLAPDGILSLTQWTSTPPRSNLKLFATAVSAMRKSGMSNPENHIAWIRSWNTATLLLKNSHLTTAEINRVRKFSEDRSFDLVWLPGIRADEVNRFQLLQKPVFYLTAKSILNDPETSFIQQYTYNLEPATDNRPYFNSYFKWSSLQDFLSLPGGAGISMIGVGYPTLLVTLLQATLAALILIVLPLLFTTKEKHKRNDRRNNIIVYFLAVGLAFLFIEIAFIQKITLILSQPLYAVAVVLCAFLVFSGLGSLFVQYRLRSQSTTIIPSLLRHSVLSIGLFTVIYVAILPYASHAIMQWPENVRIVSTFVLAAPLAFAMGMPFSLGLAAMQRNTPHLIPWAWAINGCASVLSAILAVLLAIQIGFNGVMIAAVVLYILAWRNGLRLATN